MASALEKQPWYAGIIPKQTCETFLSAPGVPEGSFVVRDSSKSPGSYSLSVRIRAQPRNFRIEKNPNSRYYLQKHIDFESILDLMRYYIGNGIYVDEHIVPIVPFTINKPRTSSQTNVTSNTNATSSSSSSGPTNRPLPPPPVSTSNPRPSVPVPDSHIPSPTSSRPPASIPSHTTTNVGTQRPPQSSSCQSSNSAIDAKPAEEAYEYANDKFPRSGSTSKSEIDLKLNHLYINTSDVAVIEPTAPVPYYQNLPNAQESSEHGYVNAPSQEAQLTTLYMNAEMIAQSPTIVAHEAQSGYLPYNGNHDQSTEAEQPQHSYGSKRA